MQPIPPNTGQLAVLLLAIGFFAVGGLLSLLRLRGDSPPLRIAAKACAYWGIISALAALVWHCIQRGNWLPLEDNFDTLIWLGLLLAIFVMYVQRRRPIGGLDWFIMPLVILMLMSAAVFGKTKPGDYHVDQAWFWVHLASTFGGALAFAIAAAVGGMYLFASHGLRSKTVPAVPRLGSLERLEQVNQTAINFGFALLTVGLITGFIRALQPGSPTKLGPNWYSSPKVILGVSVWVVYAMALHTPMNPGVRGRKAAMLSILGFVLMFATMIAVQFVPGGSH